MTSDTLTPELIRLRRSLKWSWLGPAAGIACMLALFAAGIGTETPGLVVMATSIGAALGGVWAATSTALRRRIARVSAR